MPLSQFLFSVEGRITRRDFWLKFYLPAFAMQLAAIFIDPGLLAALACAALLWPAAAVAVKRLHDRGRSGWTYLFILVPIAGPIWFLIDAGCLDGNEGPNQYGPDPKGRLAKE